MDDQGGAMSIKEIRQERAELLAEQADRKQSGRAVLTASDLDEDERDHLLAGHEERIGTIDQRLALLAKREAQWEEFKQDAIMEPAIREGQDLPTGQGKPPTPFGSLGEQLQAVAAYTRDPYSRHPGVAKLQEIQAATGAGEDVASDGGFLVQTDYTSELLRLVHETGVLAGLTDRKPISANANGLKVNAVDETSRADGSRWGGVRAYWAGEAGALTATKPKYRQMELNLQKLTGLYYATDELLADAVALGAFIQDAFAEEFGFKVDDAIIRGSGAGQPLAARPRII